MGDKRINFFTFLELGESDWQAEQAYHLNKARRAWAKGHGEGVVEGMGVEPEVPASLSIVVRAGFAVDDQGNEIVLDADQALSLAAFVPASGSQTVYVVAKVVPTEVDPAFIDELSATKNTHVEDVATIEAQTSAPGAGEIELARISLAAGASTITAAAQPDAPADNEIDLRSVRFAPKASRRHVVTLFGDEAGLPAATEAQVKSSRLHWDPAEWPQPARARLEVVAAMATAGDVGRVELWDETNGAVLFGVDVTGAAPSVFRSEVSLALPAAAVDLGVRVRTSAGAGDTILYAARLITL